MVLSCPKYCFQRSLHPPQHCIYLLHLYQIKFVQSMKPYWVFFSFSSLPKQRCPEVSFFNLEILKLRSTSSKYQKSLPDRSSSRWNQAVHLKLLGILSFPLADSTGPQISALYMFFSFPYFLFKWSAQGLAPCLYLHDLVSPACTCPRIPFPSPVLPSHTPHVCIYSKSPFAYIINPNSICSKLNSLA